MTIRRIVYFGTPDFAVPPLAALVGAGRAPVLTVTQPPRRSGRGLKLQPSAVAEAASELSLPVAAVPSVRDEESLECLRTLEPDLAVVAAFGQIFHSDLLDLPRLGCLNIHASLLPRWRGAAPIQAAIACGDRETGVSLMWMERGLDTGPVISQQSLRIGEHETAPELSRRLADLGAELLLTTLTDLDRERLAGRPQDHDLATTARQLRREDGRVDWSLPASTLYNRWRAYQPWPGLFVDHAGERIKLEQIDVKAEAPDSSAGGVMSVEDGVMSIACGEGVLDIASARRPGRNEVTGAELAAALGLHPGDGFGIQVED